MIRFVTPEWEAELTQNCGRFGIFNCKIYAQYQTYGAQSGIVDFWLVQDAQDRTVGLLSRLEGRFTAAAGESADMEELSWFLRHAGGRSAEGEKPLIERVFPERLSDVFGLLCKSDPQFAEQAHYTAWLAETSHKVRHRLMQIFILKIDNQNISTASMIYLAPRRAILAGVATDPAWRGQGYGRMVVEHTCGASAGTAAVGIGGKRWSRSVLYWMRFFASRTLGKGRMGRG